MTDRQPHAWLDGLLEAVWLVDEGSLVILYANESAQRLSKRIEGLTLDNSGTFWHSNGETLPW